MPESSQPLRNARPVSYLKAGGTGGRHDKQLQRCMMVLDLTRKITKELTSYKLKGWVNCEDVIFPKGGYH